MGAKGVGPTIARVILHVAAFDELSTGTLYALLRLRVDVFVVEQRCPYPELDGRDAEPGTRHVWLASEDGTKLYVGVGSNSTHPWPPMYTSGQACACRPFTWYTLGSCESWSPGVNPTATRAGMPSAFTWRGRRYEVRDVIGRWRIEGRWWEEGRDREYWRVEAKGGAVVDLYLDRRTDPEHWHLERLWD